MTPVAYESKTPFEVYCIFYNATDGYTFSCEVLIGVYLSKEDAETGLLEHIARAEQLKKEHDAFEARYAECRANKFVGLEAINAEHDAWKLANFEHPQFFELPDPNMNMYSIEPVEIGKIRS